MINKFLKTELARFAKDVFINSGVSVEHAEVWAEV